MRKITIALFIVGILLVVKSNAQEYVQTTTNKAYENKNFRTSGKLSIGAADTQVIGGSSLNIQTPWGTWLAFVDSYKKDVYAFHNPNNGGRMELFIQDGVTKKSQFGVFSISRNGNIGMGTNTPSGKLHVKGETYVDGGWLRVKGRKGILFQDYGGGFYMTDASWIRTYGNKNFYHNKGTMRTDGTFEVGPSGNRFRALPNGNVGIGISNPTEKLHINGSIRGNASGGALRIKSSHGSIDVGAQNTSWAHIYTDRPKIIFNKDVYTVSNAFSSYNNDLILKTKGTERLRIDDTNGNVGVGTTTPDAKLAVNGRVHAKEVKVDLNGWADYVFKSEYKLPSLQEVENHIKIKGHLINIPSEKEVLKNGIHLGGMNAKLLEKIEELTLYTIAQEKVLKEQKNKQKQLETRLAKMETLLANRKTK